MKTVFNYQKDFFKPILGYSLLAHALLIGAGTAFYGTPHFAVNQGTNSIDVVILEEKQKEIKPEEKIISHPENLVAEPEKKIAEMPEEKPKESITSLAQERAITEDDPIYLKNPAPIYPNYARRMGWEGVVILRVLVDRQGSVQEVAVEKSSGFKILDESAVKTIRKWQFDPARIGNLRFDSWVKIPIRFTLVDKT